MLCQQDLHWSYFDSSHHSPVHFIPPRPRPHLPFTHDIPSHPSLANQFYVASGGPPAAPVNQTCKYSGHCPNGTVHIRTIGHNLALFFPQHIHPSSHSITTPSITFTTTVHTIPSAHRLISTSSNHIPLPTTHPITVVLPHHHLPWQLQIVTNLVLIITTQFILSTSSTASLNLSKPYTSTNHLPLHFCIT